MVEENNQNNNPSQDTEEKLHSKVLIGDVIREAREAKNVSIKVISQHTKINVTMLELLEANRLDELPNKAYVAGYIKSCCKILGLEQDYCLGVLEVNYGNTKSEPIALAIPTPVDGDVVKSKSEANSATEKGPFPFVIAAGVVTLAIVLFVTLTGGEDTETSTANVSTEAKEITPQVEKTPSSSEGSSVEPQVVSEKTPLQDENKPMTKPVENKETVETKVEEKKEVVEQKTEVKKEVTAEVNDKKKEKESSDLPDISLKKMISPLFAYDESMSESDINSYIPANIRESLVQGKQNVFISAVNDRTWLTYKSDDQKIRKFVLQKGRTILIRGEEVILFLGNYHAVKVFLNNKPITMSSKSGVKSLVFPHEARSKYFYPLFIYRKSGKVMTSLEYSKAL